MDPSPVNAPPAVAGAQGPGGRGKALLGALAAVALAALAFLWVPHWILTVLPFGSRALRVGLATTWVGGVFVFLSWLTWRSSAPVDAPHPGNAQEPHGRSTPTSAGEQAS